MALRPGEGRAGDIGEVRLRAAETSGKHGQLPGAIFHHSLLDLECSLE